MIFGSSKENEVPAILIYDTICERYGWTFDELDRQFEQNPRRIGELLTLLDAKGRKMEKDNRAAGRQSESDARKRRLGMK